MKTKKGPEKSENSLEGKIWNAVEKYAEKCVRKEKVGYLQLLKIYEKDSGIIAPVVSAAQQFLDDETDKRYGKEDIRFFCRLSTHSQWYTWMGIGCENTKTGRTYRPSQSLDLEYDLRCEQKETFLQVKALEKKFQEEEHKAREYLHDELKEVERLRKQSDERGAQIVELREQLRKYEPEEEEETEDD